MAEYDFLSQAPSKRRGTAIQKPKQATAPPGAGKPASAKPEPLEPSRVKPPVEIVSSAAELAARSIERELEKEGYTMPAANAGSLAEAERENMIDRQQSRDEAEEKQKAFNKQVEHLKETLGEAYKRDLILQPPMWAAQDLQTGYGTRQARTAAEIEAVELPRLLRVLEAAGYTLKKKPETKPEGDAK